MRRAECSKHTQSSYRRASIQLVSVNLGQHGESPWYVWNARCSSSLEARGWCCGGSAQQGKEDIPDGRLPAVLHLLVSYMFAQCRLKASNHVHCRYSDVKHEIQEVKAGYRWVLTYNLVHCAPEGERPSAARNCLEVLSLRDNLKNWRKDLQTGESAHRQLIYLLRHKYTDASLKLSALKGRDHVKAHILKDACDESDFLLYLASLERVVSGGAEEENYSVTFHKMEDVCEDTVELKRVVDLNGNVIAEHIDINMDDVVQKKEFIEQEPDDEEYEGWTGNEGASATHWYRETVSNRIGLLHSA